MMLMLASQDATLPAQTVQQPMGSMQMRLISSYLSMLHLHHIISHPLCGRSNHSCQLSVPDKGSISKAGDHCTYPERLVEVVTPAATQLRDLLVILHQLPASSQQYLRLHQSPIRLSYGR